MPSMPILLNTTWPGIAICPCSGPLVMPGVEGDAEVADRAAGVLQRTAQRLAGEVVERCAPDGGRRPSLRCRRHRYCSRVFQFAGRCPVAVQSGSADRSPTPATVIATSDLAVALPASTARAGPSSGPCRPGCAAARSTKSTVFGAFTEPSFSLHSAISSSAVDAAARHCSSTTAFTASPHLLVGHADHRAVLHRRVRTRSPARPRSGTR